jgi:hypothetical protein
MNYIVDTSLINKLLDGNLSTSDLPTDGEFVATHIQRDEINRTKNEERRTQLNLKFNKLIDKFNPTESFVLGTSCLGEAKLGDGATYESVLKELDLLNGGKANNSEDALIAEVAKMNGYTLLTADYHLHKAAETCQINVKRW